MSKYILVLLTFWGNSIVAQNLENIQDAKPVSLHGSISLGGYYYNTNRPFARLQPYGLSASANADLQLYGWSIPFNVTYNEQGRVFTNPFNRFGMSPQYKWAKLHIGHRNYNWSQFTMAGATVFGVGAELNPGKLRLAAFRGQMREAISINDPNYFLPQYERNGYGAKLGIGGDKSFFDLSMVYGKDDLSSLSSEPDSLLNFIKAQENLVLGMNTRWSFAKDRFFIKIEGAGSIFTEDLSFSPLDLSEYPEAKRWTKYYQPNASTHGNYAGEASANLRLKNVGLSAIYRKVMPEFKSFGVNYMLTDIETITINPTISLLNSQLRLSGSYGIQRNNLDNRLVSQTNRNIGSVAISYYPNPTFGISANYSNYSLFQQVFRDDLTQDSVLINQVNHNISLTPRWTFVKPDKVQTILLMLNYQQLDEANAELAAFTNNSFFVANLTYLLSFPQKGLTINTGINLFDFNSTLYQTNQKGILLGVTKKLLDNKMNITLNNNLASLNQAQGKGLNLSVNLSASYVVLPKGTLVLQLFHLGNNIPNTSFSEQRVQLRFRQRF